MSNNTLIDFYKTGISQPQLKPGVYDCILKSHKLNTDNKENPYIALEFETKDGRILKENRFNKGFQIFISHIKQQLDKADDTIGVQELLDGLVANKTSFKIWVTKYTPANGGQTRSNFNFLEPRKKTAEESGVSVEEQSAEQTPKAKDEEVQDEDI